MPYYQRRNLSLKSKNLLNNKAKNESNRFEPQVGMRGNHREPHNLTVGVRASLQPTFL